MTHQEKLAAVREEIIKVVPEKDSPGKNQCTCPDCRILISDVLRTVNNLLFIVDGNGNFYHLKMKLSDRFPSFDSGRGTQIWNLADDDLNNQSEATINFLHEILCKQ